MMLDVLSKCLEKSVADYVEMRHHRRARLEILIKDGKVDELNNGVIEGVCVRVLVNKSWGFASTTILDRKSIEKALKEATSLAKASKPAKKREVNLARVKSYPGSYVTPVIKDPRKADKEELVRLVVDTDKEVRGFSKKVTSDNISFSMVDDDLTFLSSERARISQRIVRCFGSVMVTAREKGNIATAYEGIGAQSGLEMLNETPLNEVGKTAAERADKLVSAKVASGGVFPVILENKIVGLLAHEAVGHCAEADIVHSGSFLRDKIGKKVASNIVTLVDDGRFPAGLGTMMYDDEGVPTEKTVIIDKGICRSFLHSRETAYDFGVEPTGNARAWDFEYDPIIRMRNTYIEPGDYSLEELVEGIKDGYFLKGGLGGQADFTGEFMFGTQEAVKIKNGKLRESFRGVTICGNAFEVLKKVDAIGKDFIMRAGRCGKEQINYVGMGGASLRTELLLGGNKMNLKSSALFAVKICEKLGADEAEAFVQKQRTVEVVLERGEIQSERVKVHQGIGIRFIKDKKLGFAFSSDISKKSVQATCRNASALSKTSIPNPDWISLPTPTKIPKVAGIYDKEIAAFNSEDVLSLAKQAHKAVKEYDKRAYVDDGKFTVTSTKVAISNSYGIDLAEKSTFLNCYLVCVAKERGEVSSMAFEYEVARSMQSSPEKIGRSAAEKAVSSLRPRAIKSFRGKVILDSHPASIILLYPIIYSVNAENVQRRRSMWVNKLGMKVAAKQLSITDDGVLPNGIGSSSFDAEGVSRQKTQVITRGALKGFLYNSFTANKKRRKSTGNASRENYYLLPTVFASNFVVSSGKKKLDDIIARVNKGIIVRRFSGNIRPDSGEFSGIAKQASYIEKGEMKHALRETMISGNTFQALTNIIEIGSETRSTFVKTYAPPIMLDNINIISK